MTESVAQDINPTDDPLVFTDDAGVMEYAGEPVFLVDNPEPNLKITYPRDLAIARQAEAMLGKKIDLLMGGFHLLHDDEAAVSEVIETLAVRAGDGARHAVALQHAGPELSRLDVVGHEQRRRRGAGVPRWRLPR